MGNLFSTVPGKTLRDRALNRIYRPRHHPDLDMEHDPNDWDFPDDPNDEIDQKGGAVKKKKATKKKATKKKSTKTKKRVAKKKK